MQKMLSCEPKCNAKRYFNEKNIKDEEAFLIDKQRIIQSAAFRRLEYKTQVFLNDAGDHYRTRLTHTLEVAQIARYIARKLSLNQDLAEVVALAHDIGHPPFGHAGEKVLDDMTKVFGGFCHNVQTIRILTVLENSFSRFNGLNLTLCAIESIAKHNGSFDINTAMYKAIQMYGIDPIRNPCLEAQVASISDDIAYICHDLEDGIRSGIIAENQLMELPIINEVCYVNLSLHERLLFLRDVLINDVINVAMQSTANFSNIDSVYDNNSIIMRFSDVIEEKKTIIKTFLMNNVYSHYNIQDVMLRSQNMLRYMFDRYMNNYAALPPQWQNKITHDESDASKALVILDYISGMTDRFAMKEYAYMNESV